MHACMHDYDRESLKERASLQDLDTDGKMTLQRIEYGVCRWDSSSSR